MTVDYEKLVKLEQIARYKTNEDAANAAKFAPIGAQANVIESVKVNGSALTPDANKAVDVTVPTKTSDLTNDDNVVKDANYVHTDVNFTSAKDTKLGGIAEGAQVNVLEGITVNGTAVTPSEKVAALTIPTNNNELINGAGYQTASDVATTVEAYGYQTASDVQTAINAQVATAMDWKGTVVDLTALNAISNPKQGDVYHVTASGSEYAWNGSAWEELGVTFDATGYVQTSDISLATNADIDALFTSGE